MPPARYLFPFSAGAIAWAAAALLLAGGVGCIAPPRPARGYVTYGASAPQTHVAASAPAPASKRIAPAAASVSAAPKTVTAPPAGQTGDLDDLVAQIHERQAAKRRQARDAWLADNEGELGTVRTRLRTMRIFAATTADEALARRVREAVAATEADIDRVREKSPNRPVAFRDASLIRSALWQRHDALAASSAEYRKVAGEGK